jgi:hypothetical protein
VSLRLYGLEFLSNSNDDNETIILYIIQRLGSCDQKQIIAWANNTRPFSQPNVSKILGKLEKHGIIESKLSGNGHEKLYSIKNGVQVQQQAVSGIVLPPQQAQSPRPERRETGTPLGQYYNPNQQRPYPRQQSDNLEPFVVNGKAVPVVYGYTFDTRTGRMIPLIQYEIRPE